MTPETTTAQATQTQGLDPVQVERITRATAGLAEILADIMGK